ncbi:hypothetical protein B0T20DRAFT_393057 [Sordaria brevicollis]|uniref:Uncharacterized protein n=1 Tax=Sordaria brevicollis TaxID=83679 RepID=A0AAE0PEU2_SORBR|nr:hypothetical protein B0T20DRAFT_393057 [Sordaria brevicollis]
MPQKGLRAEEHRGWFRVISPNYHRIFRQGAHKRGLVHRQAQYFLVRLQAFLHRCKISSVRSLVAATLSRCGGALAAIASRTRIRVRGPDGGSKVQRPNTPRDPQRPSGLSRAGQHHLPLEGSGRDAMRAVAGVEAVSRVSPVASLGWRQPPPMLGQQVVNCFCGSVSPSPHATRTCDGIVPRYLRARGREIPGLVDDDLDERKLPEGVDGSSSDVVGKTSPPAHLPRGGPNLHLPVGRLAIDIWMHGYLINQSPAKMGGVQIWVLTYHWRP